MVWRRLLCVTLVSVATLALDIPHAPATVHTLGATWLSDGRFERETAGRVFSFFATRARAQALYRLVAGPEDPAQCVVGGRQINPGVRGSTTRGLIPTTVGTLDGPPGTYEVCFEEISEPPDGFPTVTAPVYLTLL